MTTKFTNSPVRSIPPLVSTVSLGAATTLVDPLTTRLTTTKAFDYLNRLRSVTSVPSGVGQSVLGYGYVYNDANQRVEQQLPDGSAWGYGYDSLGQLSSAKRRWTDQSPVEGQQFECGYDTIGNGKTVKAGGVPTTAALVCSGSKMLSLIMLLRLGCGFAIGTQPPK